MTRGDRKGRNQRIPEPPEDLDPGESTLESFVARLHDEGVQAGRDEAERLVREARLEAERILDGARRDAERMAEEASARAERDLERGRAELELAARDAVLQLSSALAEGLRSILTRSIEGELNDPALVRTLLTEAVSAYARADADGGGRIEVRVPDELAEGLEVWAMKELASGIEGGNGLSLAADLREAGFEYSVGDGTVEVTVSAAVDLLMQLLTPRLREVLQRAVHDVQR
jgi:V/A-type H+-transporting ATPase subunit E